MAFPRPQGQPGLVPKPVLLIVTIRWQPYVSSKSLSRLPIMPLHLPHPLIYSSTLSTNINLMHHIGDRDNKGHSLCSQGPQSRRDKVI